MSTWPPHRCRLVKVSGQLNGVAPALDDAGFSEQRLDGPSILFLAGGTELVVHVLGPAAGFAGHLLRHMTDKYHEAVDARCQQGRDGDVLPPHGDHLIWLLFREAALPGLCQTASSQWQASHSHAPAACPKHVRRTG